MARSTVHKFVDRLRRRPEWLECDGRRQVLVRGYSPIDNLIYGAIGAVAILLPIAVVLGMLP